MGDNIKTYVRIKPDTDNPDFLIKGNIIIHNDKPLKFDKVFIDSSQKELFDVVSEDILVSTMQGYNCTIFAYGQTGSGKTFTIQGKENNPGLVQRCLCFLHNLNLEINLSFIEIYNENMIDLLDDTKVLNIRDDPVNSVTVDNLTLVRPVDYESSLQYYENGIKLRKTKSTNMNIESSRSHSVFTIYIKNMSNNILKESKLSFIDLAGSERLKNLEIENLKIKETANINKSLFCLGKIIYKLSEDNNKHIGYRDSKLTFLLKDSLGGNSKLRVIGNVCLENKLDTQNTLNFLCRLKMINNVTFINSNFTENIPDLQNQMKALDQENQKLRTKIALYETGNRKIEKEEIDEFNFNILQLKGHMKNVIEDFKELERVRKDLDLFEYEVKKKVILDCEKIYKDLLETRNKENP
ncbi:kinesin-like protein [Vairimorpha necatrix]|uniref:Kinesin-like protein n=1 Tax=Vairimorpha necatrix TaxID=6039 RepID=A0AAX4JDC8_9MICR